MCVIHLVKQVRHVIVYGLFRMCMKQTSTIANRGPLSSWLPVGRERLSFSAVHALHFASHLITLILSLIILCLNCTADVHGLLSVWDVVSGSTVHRVISRYMTSARDAVHVLYQDASG
jgi:hypothetical protein